MDSPSASHTPTTQQFCLRWHNHQTSLLSSLPQLFDQSHLTDVTISADGRSIRAHRVVLSACSSFFSELFRTLEPMHPVIVIPGTSYKSVLALLTFMYSGEVNVFEEEISSLLALAETLGIKGLADFHDNVTKTTTHPTPKSSPDSVSSPQHTSSYKDHDSSPASPISSKLSSPFENFFPRPMNLYPPLLTQPLNFSCSRTASDFFAKFSMPPFMAASKPMNSNSNDDNNNNINDSDVERKANAEVRKSKAPDKKKIDKIAENLRSTTITTPTSSNQYLFPKSPLMMNPSPPITPGGMLMKPPAFPNHFLADSFMAKGAENLLFDNQSLNMNDVKHEQELLIEKKPPISKLYATCFICNKQLSNQYNLRVHLETHQNVRYACTVCAHVSRSKDALRKHISYRHPGTPSPCETETRRKRSKTNNLRLECIDPSNSQPGLPISSPMSSGSPKTPTSIHSPIAAMSAANLFKLPTVDQSTPPATVLSAMQAYPMMVMSKPNPHMSLPPAMPMVSDDNNVPKDLSCPSDVSASVSG